jgi:hypothetical protein
LSPHPSVIIGNRPSEHVGQGVFVGQGKAVVPLDDPNAPNKTRCAGTGYADNGHGRAGPGHDEEQIMFNGICQN